ncbi:hypothetical protein [Streptomyces violaceus]|uniref:DUF5667 domain-containing protein n=1 Tax=Streptomyces violaceus TaxID=1936 RepID=A0ABZ1NRI1_STRVL
MTARNENNENNENADGRRDGSDGCGDGEYGGMDALMAAIVGDPVPEGARQDADYVAAHRAAVTDVALLREQLMLMGDTLARGDGAQLEAGAGTEAGAGAQARADAGDPAEAGEPAGRTPAAGPAAGPGTAAHAAGPGTAADPSVRVLPVRPRGAAPRRGRPRPLSIALRGLVAAAAATVVVGMGWLVVQGGAGSGDGSAGSSAADSAARPQHGSEDAKLGHAGYLACAGLVVEGTVAEVEPVPGTGQERVTLDVERSYKPAKGQERVVFPMSEDVDPRLRPGDHVLVGITGGQAEPDLWSVGEKEIARERAWITAALPGSRTIPCP